MKVIFDAKSTDYYIKQDNGKFLKEGGVLKKFFTKRDANAYIKSLSKPQPIINNAIQENKIPVSDNAPDGIVNTELKETVIENVPAQTNETIIPDADLPPVTESDTKPLSIFSDLSIKTEEDKKQLLPDALENLGNEIGDDSFTFGASSDNPDDDTPENKKANAQIMALLWVSLMDIIFCLGCQWLSGDWSAEGEKRYSISKEKRDNIKRPLFQLIMQRKKKSNPMWLLIGAILLSYAPLILLALADMKRRKLQAVQMQQQQAAYMQQQKTNPVFMQPAGPIMNNPIMNDFNTPIGAKNAGPKKSGRGRPTLEMLAAQGDKDAQRKLELRAQKRK